MRREFDTCLHSTGVAARCKGRAQERIDDEPLCVHCGMSPVGYDFATTYGQWTFTDSDYIRSALGRRMFRRAKRRRVVPMGLPEARVVNPYVFIAGCAR